MKQAFLTNYSYTLPRELIANSPAVPRDSARLFIYNTTTNEVTFDTFRNMPSYLPQESCLVINNTKVVPARLLVKKETGGEVELLILLNEWRPGMETVRALVNKKVNIGQQLFLDGELLFTAEVQEGSIFTLRPSVPAGHLLSILEKYGTTPLPRYIAPDDTNETHVREQYQSMFAETVASVAAPTASLHFTPEVFAQLDTRSIPRIPITLHVGLGTFAPVTDKQLAEKSLHPEFVEITKEAAQDITRHKGRGASVIAVGTTAARALESASTNGITHEMTDFTRLFITPGDTFNMVDGLITNFHLPSTSLMMLVDAFLQHKQARRSIMDLYAIAIKEKFRFYSFGDAMLIL